MTTVSCAPGTSVGTSKSVENKTVTILIKVKSCNLEHVKYLTVDLYFNVTSLLVIANLSNSGGEQDIKNI